MMSEIRAESLSVKYCQQDPLRTSGGGLYLSGQIPALPLSHLLLLFSSIPALKKETGMQTDECAQSILAHWKGGPSSLKPLACRHQSCWGYQRSHHPVCSQLLGSLYLWSDPTYGQALRCPSAQESFQVLTQDQQLGLIVKILASFISSTHTY